MPDFNLFSTIDHRDLQPLICAGGFRRQRALVFGALRATEHVASCHPAALYPFAQDDRVKFVAVLNRNHTRAGLVQVVQAHPGHQRLVCQGHGRDGGGVGRKIDPAEFLDVSLDVVLGGVLGWIGGQRGLWVRPGREAVKAHILVFRVVEHLGGVVFGAAAGDALDEPGMRANAPPGGVELLRGGRFVHHPIRFAQHLRADNLWVPQVEATQPDDAVGLGRLGRLPDAPPATVQCPALKFQRLLGVHLVLAGKRSVEQFRIHLLLTG